MSLVGSGGEGKHWLAREGVGESQFRRGVYCTLWYSLLICTLRPQLSGNSSGLGAQNAGTPWICHPGSRDSLGFGARICKLLRSPGIDSKASIHQAGKRFLGSLQCLQIRVRTQTAAAGLRTQGARTAWVKLTGSRNRPELIRRKQEQPLG